ncbi:hypothetical protein CYMTET_8131 [Cymbomonas tetramitiformis]|uniref:O-phosphoseryl-tRNA(Sec) selenium transferase n=1 Tax=Cymbomonas tetramitiformis TaxID=36881 RepID=A0AAE0LGB0_9CHLO|nr:hypothetical protein CYMTET_8131 [Cymbomonas tetramitiformis]
MNAENLLLAQNLVSQTYINQGRDGIARRQNLIKSLLSNRRLPENGWDDASIEMLLQDCSNMDSNNFVGNVGVGEREARVASAMVATRHYRMAHGIGRSGDVAAEQPKAAGSSLLAKLCNLLTADALNTAGLHDLGGASVLPLATGMTVTMALLALKQKRPAGARYVLWPRIKKTCIKAVVGAGLELVVIPNLLVGEQLETDVALVRTTIDELGADSILCVLSTTSCFAPRGPDKVIELVTSHPVSSPPALPTTVPDM